MSFIFIASFPADTHADAVLWGLRRRGEAAELWQPFQFPARQALTIAFEPDGAARHAVDAEDGPIAIGEAKTIWNRRSLSLRLADGIDPRDRDFAERESMQHLEGFLATAAPRALWVNPPAAARRDLDKAAQLRRAAALGFTIPATLLSNAPDEVIRFFDAHGGDIVYKSYRPERWSDEEDGRNTLANRTAAVTREDLASRAALAFCPGIFQARIEKAFELRVTVMGETFFCVRIDAADSAAARLDWRSDQRRMRLSVVPLADEVREKCRAFMADAGLVFACFDIIVTPSGTPVFLEANQMGQFLWIEEHLPELPLLDAMCAFLASGDPHFVWRAPPAPLRLSDWAAWRGAARPGQAA